MTNCRPTSLLISLSKILQTLMFNTLSLTSALDEGGWSTPRLGRFTPGKETRYPLYRRLVGPQGRSVRVLKISPPPGFDLRTVQLSRLRTEVILADCYQCYVGGHLFPRWSFWSYGVTSLKTRGLALLYIALY